MIQEETNLVVADNSGAKRVDVSVFLAEAVDNMHSVGDIIVVSC